MLQVKSRPSLHPDQWTFGYHATGPECLERIAKGGLQKNSVSGQQSRADFEQPDAVYFSNAQGYHLYYGPALLRFPWPGGAQDHFQVNGEPVLLEARIDHVPAEQLQVLTEDLSWAPLREALKRGCGIYNADQHGGYPDGVFAQRGVQSFRARHVGRQAGGVV